MMKIKYIVVHCSDSPDDLPLTAADIHHYHSDHMGWDGIGYHAVVLRNGLVEHGRPIYWQGAHVRRHNHESLGVCLIGKSEFSPSQFQSLESVIRQWLRQFPSAQVVGHRDLDSRKTCPNFNVKHWAHARRLLPTIRRKHRCSKNT